ncbi:PREDICTED: uncharacterized protein LOC104605451 [Nelumbo nucifera]|uniref:Uncharacterized protein LOC104605451 n=2 Tax=Nelumbo nucifera TaxID=4432 RepID=A0A1U8AMA8_NELNU|nr:PREDICTED: uncharacterized protein LOC104605451 [Nelumbo nucifera]DAD45587.1 TPA_asm: hypothetical protein HUJ06_003817 [Nelumbo nucifera]
MSTQNTMKSSGQLGVAGILIDALKILFNGGKLMASIFVFTIFPSFLLFLGNHFSTKTLVLDLVLKIIDLQQSTPGSAEYIELMGEIRSDVGILMVTEGIFIAAVWLVCLFVMIATIYASAVNYSGGDLTLKELISRIRATWTSPAITWFYISLFNLGCTLLVWASLGFFFMVATGSSGSIALTAIAFMVALLFLCIALYLSLVSIVSLVVSVLEDGCYGMEAIGKAEGLIKGRRLQGSLLIVLCGLVLVPISGFLGFEMSNVNFTEATRLRIAVLVISIICMVKIFSLTVFTVFYYQCNEIPAEEVQVQQGKGYNKVPSDEGLP